MNTASVPTAAVVDVAGNLSSKVELHMSCRDLKNMDLMSKSDPFVVVYSRDRHDLPWRELMRTKTVQDNLNPDFTDSVIMNYHFELVQDLRFEVYDRDSDSNDLKSQDFIGAIETNLARVMGSRGSTYSADLVKPGSHDKRGRIIVRGEEVSACKDVVHVQFAAKGLDRKDWFGFGRSDPFVTISRAREDGSSIDEGFLKVWESDVIKKELNPVWKPAVIPVQVLCNGDLDRPIRIQVFDWNSNGSHELIGRVVTSVRGLAPGKAFTLINPDLQTKKGDKYKGSGEFIVQKFALEKRFSFLDYIRGGCELNLMVAIDFTASNGAPSTKTSLHHMPPNLVWEGSMRTRVDQLNEYQRAILAIGQILQDYDSDNQIPLYGFGGAVNGTTNHCFPLTFDATHPEVEGIVGIQEAYQNAFNYVSLSGPTYFSHVLQRAKAYALEQDCSQNHQSYSILLILTDGIINDMDQTIDQIVQISHTAPLSIIIVGVGSADFSNMDILDADDTPLRGGNGMVMQRDIVQFVPFRKFAAQHFSTLAQETLAEIPDQLVSFMKSRNIRPNPPSLASARHLAIERSQRGLTGAPVDAPSENVPMAVPLNEHGNTAPSAPPPPNSSSHYF